MKIRGNTVGTTMPRPDFNQDNSAKADFIKNRPLDRILPEVTSGDNGKVLKVSGGKWALGDDNVGEGGIGRDGVGISSVKQTTESSADGGANVITVTLTNGTKSTFTVKNGSKGSTGAQGPKGDTGATGATGASGARGANGKDGYTPVKGKDYFTQEDIDEIVERVLNALPYASVYKGEVVTTTKKIIKFKINNVEYEASEGMTFRDWCDDNSLYEHGDWHIEKGSYGDQITDNTGEWVNGYDTDYAFAEDVIVAGHNYFSDGHG